MNHRKKLLVFLPTYNRDEFIKIQLNKLIMVKKNSDLKVDIKVINNASTKKTAIFLDSFHEKEVSVISNEKNKNWSELIHQISELAKSESLNYDYFWTLSDDDFILENELLKFFNLLNNTSEVDSMYLLKSIKISHQGNKLIRPTEKEGLFSTLNDSLLISTIIYPAKNLVKFYDYYADLLINNEFAHASFILSALKVNPKIKISKNVVFVERNNFIWHNDLFKCFYKDRMNVLKEFDKILATNNSKKYVLATTNFFIKRVIIWFYVDNIDGKDVYIKKMIWASIKNFQFNFKFIFFSIIYFIFLFFRNTFLLKKIVYKKCEIERQSRLLNDSFVDDSKILREYA